MIQLNLCEWILTCFIMAGCLIVSGLCFFYDRNRKDKFDLYMPFFFWGMAAFWIIKMFIMIL